MTNEYLKKRSETFIQDIAKESLQLRICLKNPDIFKVVREETLTALEELQKQEPEIFEETLGFITRYYQTRDQSISINDFIQLLSWYEMSFKKEEVGYYSKNCEHFNLRMSEVINMFLIAKLQLKVI